MSSKRARYRRKVERRAGHPRWLFLKPQRARMLERRFQRRLEAVRQEGTPIGDDWAHIEPGLSMRFDTVAGVLHVIDTRDAVLTIHAGDRNGLES